MTNCPKCKTPTLKPFEIDSVTVERCSSCRGIWFDADELGHLLREQASQVTDILTGSVNEEIDAIKGLCPRDGSQLMRVYSSIDRTVVVDACGQCRGIWLDGGEFKKLFEALRRS
jgi:uncharacterized protein